MLDELAYWYHFWWLRTWIEEYPLWLGLIAGYAAGYGTEPFVDYCERISARRALRRRLKNNIYMRKLKKRD